MSASVTVKPGSALHGDWSQTILLEPQEPRRRGKRGQTYVPLLLAALLVLAALGPPVDDVRWWVRQLRAELRYHQQAIRVHADHNQDLSEGWRVGKQSTVTC